MHLQENLLFNLHMITYHNLHNWNTGTGCLASVGKVNLDLKQLREGAVNTLKTICPNFQSMLPLGKLHRVSSSSFIVTDFEECVLVYIIYAVHVFVYFNKVRSLPSIYQGWDS